MNFKIRLGICAALFFSLIACGSPPDEAKNNAPTTSNPTSVADADVLASVNGETITREMVESHKESRGSGEEQLDDEIVVEELINLILLKHEAIKQGLDKSPEAVLEIERQRTAVLANQLIQSQTTNATFSDEELRAEYDVQRANMPKEYRARHILVKEQQEAEELIKQLQGGAQFEKLAAEKSIDPSGKNGGDLDWFRVETMVPEFSAAIARLEKQQFTVAPVKTDYGWHIIKLEDSRELPLPEFELVQKQLERIMANRRLQEFVQNLRAQAKIEIDAVTNSKPE